MSGEEIGFAFIGAGAVARWHAAAVAACPRARLVGVYNPSRERAAALAAESGSRVYATPEEAFADPAVQAVSILSPVERHHEQALAALAAGKHVLIEKPVAWTVGEIEEIAAAAKASGRVCMPGHNYVYDPAVRRLKKRIERGAFGRIVAAWIVYTLHHPDEVAAKYPGVIRQITTHHCYALLYLLGKPKRLVALASESRPAARRLGREDQVALLAEMEDGALVNLFAGFAADDQTSDPWTVLFKVLGTEGGGTFSWRDGVQTQPGAGLSWRYPAYEESFIEEVAYFVDDCILGGKAPLSTIEDAREAQRLIEAAERAVATGRAVDVRIGGVWGDCAGEWAGPD
jgi:predicted dehydrogenase